MNRNQILRRNRRKGQNQQKRVFENKQFFRRHLSADPFKKFARQQFRHSGTGNRNGKRPQHRVIECNFCSACQSVSECIHGFHPSHSGKQPSGKGSQDQSKHDIQAQSRQHQQNNNGYQNRIFQYFPQHGSKPLGYVLYSETESGEYSTGETKRQSRSWKNSPSPTNSKSGSTFHPVFSFYSPFLFSTPIFRSSLPPVSAADRDSGTEAAAAPSAF